MTKIIKVDSTKLKNATTKPTPTDETIEVYYTGEHPHLLNSMGVAYYDDGHKSWLYKPEVMNADWYRVHYENLTPITAKDTLS